MAHLPPGWASPENNGSTKVGEMRGAYPRNGGGQVEVVLGRAGTDNPHGFYPFTWIMSSNSFSSDIHH